MRCVKKRSFHKVTLKRRPDCFVATCPVSRTDTVPSVETLEKFARALDVPMYQLFYDGKNPPKLPNLPKRKSAEDIAWGSEGKDARWLYQFSRLLARTEETDRKLLMFMALKMARAKAV